MVQAAGAPARRITRRSRQGQVTQFQRTPIAVSPLGPETAVVIADRRDLHPVGTEQNDPLAGIVQGARPFPGHLDARKIPGRGRVGIAIAERRPVLHHDSHVPGLQAEIGGEGECHRVGQADTSEVDTIRSKVRDLDKLVLVVAVGIVVNLGDGHIRGRRRDAVGDQEGRLIDRRPDPG